MNQELMPIEWAAENHGREYAYMRDRPRRPAENVGDLVRHRLSWQCLALLAATLAFSPVSERADQRAGCDLPGHVAHFDAAGHLLPWILVDHRALSARCSSTDSARQTMATPVFVTETFLEADWSLVPDRRDTIPAMQSGMGILSYLKLYALRGTDAMPCTSTRARRAMGDYLVREALTTRAGQVSALSLVSTGTRGTVFRWLPTPAHRADHPYEIEPDKGGIAGYALVAAVRDQRRAQVSGGRDCRTPAFWPPISSRGDGLPFSLAVSRRLSHRCGVRGPVSGNMTYILRFVRRAAGRTAIQNSRYRGAAPLWRWIKHYQIPSGGRGWRAVRAVLRRPRCAPLIAPLGRH